MPHLGDAVPVEDGTANASLNFIGVKGTGLSVGVGGSTTVNKAEKDTQTGVAALGWGFAMGGVEAIYRMRDLNDSKNYTLAGAVTLDGHHIYFSGLGGTAKPEDANFAAVRLGFKFSHMDFSAYYSKTFKDGFEPILGATFRICF